jgi:hypothetical protein
MAVLQLTVDGATVNQTAKIIRWPAATQGLWRGPGIRSRFDCRALRPTAEGGCRAFGRRPPGGSQLVTRMRSWVAMRLGRSINGCAASLDDGPGGDEACHCVAEATESGRHPEGLSAARFASCQTVSGEGS